MGFADLFQRVRSAISVKENLGNIYGSYAHYKTHVLNLYKTDRLRVYGLSFLITMVLVCVFFAHEPFILKALYNKKDHPKLHEDLVVIGFGPHYYSDKGEEISINEDSLFSIIDLAHRAGAAVIGVDQQTPKTLTNDQEKMLEAAALKTVFIEKTEMLAENEKIRLAPLAYLGIPFIFNHDLPWGKGYGALRDDFVWEMSMAKEITAYGDTLTVPSFALSIIERLNTTAASSSELDKIAVWNNILHSYNYPSDESSMLTKRVPIDFYDFNRVPIMPAGSVRHNPSQLSNKIVLIGVHQFDLDLEEEGVYLTPLGPANSVLVHASIINNLLQKSYLMRTDWKINVCSNFGSLLAGAFFFWLFNVFWGKRIGQTRHRHALPISIIIIIQLIYFLLCVQVFSNMSMLAPIHSVWLWGLVGGIAGIFYLDFREYAYLQEYNVITQNANSDEVGVAATEKI